MSAEPTTMSTSRAALAMRGGVVAYVVVLVLLPLGALTVHGLEGGVLALLSAISAPEAADALILTLWTAALVTLLNAVMGTATAWVLVRFRFPGRRLLGALIDLPLAIPTLVTGIMLVILLGPASPIGAFLAARGFDIAFHTPAIVLALAFVSFPFTVRSVEPVLRELDPAEEEAASTLGASPLTTLRKVVMPALLPSIAAGAMQCFARAIAEFGSIIVVSGNIPHRTLTAPVYVFGEVESGRSELAASVSIVLLLLALAMTVGSRLVERLSGGADD